MEFYIGMMITQNLMFLSLEDAAHYRFFLVL